ncbi:putative ribonuclease H-like domain-containing protein [Tanacetum coccineum]|uniref:Ribonuclease H-like domain-containing protein n=1 Tax=Tanacetum coccineum TaxID=301880 RepID=A0ABQ4YJQ5_9ASTR
MHQSTLKKFDLLMHKEIQVSDDLGPKESDFRTHICKGNPLNGFTGIKVVMDSGCSGHDREHVLLQTMEKIDAGYVAFGGWKPKGGIILRDRKSSRSQAEAVNTACYVQNRVLVVKPHNKTPYKLFHGRTPTLSSMRPFGCLVTILNTIDHLGKFDGKADEGSGPDWLFDIDALTKTMNSEPIVAGTQSNGFAGTKASDNAGQARKETEPVKDYILLSLWTTDPPFSQGPKSSHDDGSKPSSVDEKKVDEDPRKENEYMPALEDISTFDFSNEDEDDGVNDDMNNLDTAIQVSPILTTIIHKINPLDQAIRDLQSVSRLALRVDNSYLRLW